MNPQFSLGTLLGTMSFIKGTVGVDRVLGVSHLGLGCNHPIYHRLVCRNEEPAEELSVESIFGILVDGIGFGIVFSVVGVLALFGAIHFGQ